MVEGVGRLTAAGRCAVLVLAAALLTAAQAPRPEFDAASIKRQRDSDVSPSARIAPAGLTARRQSVKWLIGYTYRFRSDRIVGGPDWLDSDQYDIVARSNRPDATMDSVNEMIKTLLADRFQLRAHVETRPTDVYALVIAARDGRLGPSLKPSAGCAQGRVITSQPTFGDGKSRACGTRSLFDRGLVSIEAGGRPLADLVRSLDGNVGRPVVNKTGLMGLYDFDLRFTPSPAPGTVAEPGDVPEVFTALREQLGLALRSEPGSVDVLVIDHVEMPSPD